MAYQITAETPTEIILTPAVPPTGCLRWVTGGLGLVFLLVGAGLLGLRAERGADSLNLVAGVFTVFGLGFVGLALTLKAGKGPGPAALVFDQRRAGVWLRGPAAAAAAAAAFSPALLPAEAFLPFADISALRVIVHSHTSSSSSGSHSRTTYSYHVALNLADGGTWTLTTDTQQVDAENIMARLQALMARAATAPATAPPPPVLPAALTLTRQGALAQLRWRNPLTNKEIVRSLVGMAFVAAFLGVFWVVMGDKRELPVFVFAVLGFIGTVFGWIVLAQVRQWWRDRHCRYGLDFGPGAVAYLELDAATGRETWRHPLPLANYHGLSTSFDAATAATDLDPVVLLLSHAAHAQLQQRQAPEPDGITINAALGNLVREALAKNLALPVRVKSLAPAQRLALVQWARIETERLRTAG